jgi:SH3 domain protein
MLKKRSSTPYFAFFLLRHLILTLLLACLFSGIATASSTYSVITSEPEVPVRSGQGTEYKILALLKNGETITSMEEDGYWSRVRTATGKEGWMLKRYLSTSPSADVVFNLPAAGIGTPDTPSVKQAATSGQSTALLPSVTSTNQVTPPPEMQIPPHEKQSTPDTEISISELRRQLVAVTQENILLRENDRIKWFLAGGGTLLVGWLIGLITCRSRKRKPSLL